MANQPANLPAAAHVVGNAFVNQYYNVLHQSPQVVHRFYTDASRLTRAEAGADGAVDTLGTQQEIYMKVMSADYIDLKAEIKTVDSQDSHGGGVLVLVTGSLSTKSNEKRNFVQSFFLAPQEKGYFVLNDILRYLDLETHQTPKTVYPRVESNESSYSPEPSNVHQYAPVLELVSIPEPEMVREISIVSESETLAQEVHHHSELPTAEDADQVGPSAVEIATTVVIEESKPLMVQNTQAANIYEQGLIREMPKKSYASILKVYGTPIKAAPQLVGERIVSSSSPSPNPVSSPPGEALDKSAHVENEDGRSVYVKNLPMNITTSQLQNELSHFGLVKPGGVNVKNQKQGVCYAFVEFEEQSGALNAIEGSPVSIEGRQVYIEEKKTMGRGPRRLSNNRSERPYRGNKSEGARGRGPYGGRSYGRGDGQDFSGPCPGHPSSNGIDRSAPGLANNGGDRRNFQGQRAARSNPGPTQRPRTIGLAVPDV